EAAADTCVGDIVALTPTGGGGTTTTTGAGLTTTTGAATTTTTKAGATKTTTLVSSSPLCCAGGGALQLGAAGGTSGCISAGGTPGAPGPSCDGVPGGWVASPSVGSCCNFPVDPMGAHGCFAGPSVTASACNSTNFGFGPGVLSTNQICTATNAGCTATTTTT